MGDKSSVLAAREILERLGVQDVVEVSPVTTGWGDTAIWRVQRTSSVSALRLFRQEAGPACRREVAAMRAALAAGVPVPEIQAEEYRQGRPALLLSWCPGRPIAEEVRARPWRLWRVAVAFGRTHAELHRVKAPPGVGEGVSHWTSWAGPEEQELQARLRALPLRDDALLHLDYHPANVLVDGIHLTGVIDWANARAGDPRADVARTFTMARLMPMPPSMPRLPTNAALRVLEHGWRLGYESVAGPLGDLTLFCAWAGAAMIRDLTPKLGRPGFWVTPAHLDRIGRHVTAWKQRAGLS